MSLILASQSSSRFDLLKQIGYTPDKVAPQDVDETPLPKELPRDYVQRVTHLKVESALKEFPKDIIVAADTIVVRGRRIILKPETPKEAFDMIWGLSGKRVRIITTVCVAQGTAIRHKNVVTISNIKRLSKFELERYVETGLWQGCSGGIAIENIGGTLIKSISGSYSNVVGLPLYETRNLLESFGVFADWMRKEEKE